MGACTNCNGKVGCDHRKGAMLESIDAALARLYPTRTWGEPDDTVAEGLGTDDIGHLADELASELGAATFVRTGGDDEPCDYIYVLCLGRTPCIVQVRDCGVPAPAEWVASSAPTISELYLRLVLSHRASVAAVQQVAIDVTAAAPASPDVPARDRAWLIQERPRAGVYDAPLLARMQKLVAILPAYGLLHVDFGEIAHKPPGYLAGSWSSLFQGEPSIANYLFYPHPTTMNSTVVVEPHL